MAPPDRTRRGWVSDVTLGLLIALRPHLVVPRP